MGHDGGGTDLPLWHHLGILDLLYPGIDLLLYDSGVFSVIMVAGYRHADSLFYPFGGLFGIGVSPTLTLLDGPDKAGNRLGVLLDEILGEPVKGEPGRRSETGVRGIGNLDRAGVVHPFIERGVYRRDINQPLLQGLDSLDV